VKRLLARGADVVARDDRGKTALAIAMEQGYAEVTNVLRAAGARD
jgi:ankyrin repeat protein